MPQGTLSATPSSYSSTVTVSNPTKAYTNADSTTYASFTVTNGTRQSASFYFDFSEIPDNAGIISVVAHSKAKVNSTSYISTESVQAFFAGSSQRGDSVRLTTTASKETWDFSGSDWSVSDLKQAYVKYTLDALSQGYSRTVSIFGADMTVVYSYGDRLYVKKSSAWQFSNKAFKKVSSAWVEQNDMTQVFDETKRWRGVELKTATGTTPLSLPGATADPIVSLVQAGRCIQASAPTPTSPVSIVCNNGALKVDANGNVYADGTPETVNAGNQTASVVNLIGVGNFLGTQDIISGDLTYNAYVIYFDGSEDWTFQSSTKTIYLTNAGSLAIQGLSAATEIDAFCTHFVFNSGETIAAMNDKEFLFNVGSGVRNGRVSFKYESAFTSLANAKYWLSQQYQKGTPVMIVYPIASPVTDSTFPQSLNLANGADTISVSSEVGNAEMTVQYYGEL